jgi:hypothetical protein
MANRTTYPMDTVKSDCTLVTGKLVGAGGTDDLVVVADGGETVDDIVSATYSATGVYTLVFRHSYPELKSVLSCPVVGTTDGLFAMFSAIDVTAKTATIEFYVGSTKTVLATTDTCYVNLLVRNSGRNS